jgi:hypothetical protein
MLGRWISQCQQGNYEKVRAKVCNSFLLFVYLFVCLFVWRWFVSPLVALVLAPRLWSGWHNQVEQGMKNQKTETMSAPFLDRVAEQPGWIIATD